MEPEYLYQANTSAGRYYFMAADLEHAAWHAFALSKELDATLYDVIEVHDAEKEAVLSK